MRLGRLAWCSGRCWRWAETRLAAAAYLSNYQNQSGAAIIYSKLEEYGVQVVNGFSGGAVLLLLDQFHPTHPRHVKRGKDSIRWITNSNESSAGHIAEGYAKSVKIDPSSSPPVLSHKLNHSFTHRHTYIHIYLYITCWKCKQTKYSPRLFGCVLVATSNAYIHELKCLFTTSIINSYMNIFTQQ